MDLIMDVYNKKIDELKSQIDSEKKKQEYEQLKRDLFDISYQANHAPTEFDGGMLQVDTEQNLRTKRGKESFSELFIARIIKMFNARPVIGNLIAIGLAIIGIACLYKYMNNPELKTLKGYLAHLIEIAGAVQVLKSASRSILLPLVATAMGGIISNQLTGTQLLFNQPSLFFQAMLITGLVGIAISVFSID